MTNFSTLDFAESFFLTCLVELLKWVIFYLAEREGEGNGEWDSGKNYSYVLGQMHNFYSRKQI